MRLNPYKIGIVFYSVLVISVFFLSTGHFEYTKHQKKELTSEEGNARMFPVKLNNQQKQCHNNNNLLFGVLVLI